MKWLLFYKPPCGVWYAHSHKLYDTLAQVQDAADKFIAPGTPYMSLPVDTDKLERQACIKGVN